MTSRSSLRIGLWRWQRLPRGRIRAWSGRCFITRTTPSSTPAWCWACSDSRAVQSLSAVTGACLLVRRDVYESVGGLDERLPVEFNDVDFCLRVRQCGYRNVWTPHAELYHHESASRSVDGATPRKARFAEVALMQARWGGLLQADPAYNPNLSLQGRDFELAFPPRRPGKAGQCIGYDGA